MQKFFAIFFWLFFIATIFGLIKPSTVLRWADIKTRRKVLSTFGSLTVLSLLLCVIGSFVDNSNGDYSTEHASSHTSTEASPPPLESDGKARRTPAQSKEIHKDYFSLFYAGMKLAEDGSAPSPFGTIDPDFCSSVRAALKGAKDHPTALVKWDESTCTKELARNSLDPNRCFGRPAGFLARVYVRSEIEKQCFGGSQ